MAKQSFLQRFPHSGIILVLAVFFAIPLTLWSFNNASTQTQQHASTFSPTPTPYLPSCSSKSGTCMTSNLCNTEGFGTISGTSCAVGTVCCKLKLTPTPLPKCSSAGGICVPSTICSAEGKGRISATGCSAGTVCCKF